MELVIYPNAVLSKKCKEVEIGDMETVALFEGMFTILYEFDGAGLVAPQIGISKKIVAIDLRNERDIYKMINPKIVWKSDELMESTEGCLSIPMLRDTVIRHAKVSVEYLDENFQKCFINEAEGYLAVCLQHELDHLDGKVYIDRLSRLKRSKAIKRYKKLLEHGQLASEENDKSDENLQ
ncbi:peptide deformylase 2 [Alphaproteobacteria bacterium]|nr:peptide deformylase 2 [Alphaproteobacteria bacterium]